MRSRSHCKADTAGAFLFPGWVIAWGWATRETRDNGGKLGPPLLDLVPCQRHEGHNGGENEVPVPGGTLAAIATASMSRASYSRGKG
jgi:hypothetical protein